MLVLDSPSDERTNFHGKDCGDEERLVTNLRQEDEREGGQEAALPQRPIDKELLRSKMCGMCAVSCKGTCLGPIRALETVKSSAAYLDRLTLWCRHGVSNSRNDSED